MTILVRAEAISLVGTNFLAPDQRQDQLQHVSSPSCAPALDAEYG